MKLTFDKKTGKILEEGEEIAECEVEKDGGGLTIKLLTELSEEEIDEVAEFAFSRPEFKGVSDYRTVPHQSTKKKTAKKKEESEVELPETDSIKDPDYVRALHERDFVEFKRTYGVPDSEKKRSLDSITRENRYPAKRTTILTQKLKP